MYTMYKTVKDALHIAITDYEYVLGLNLDCSDKTLPILEREGMYMGLCLYFDIRNFGYHISKALDKRLNKESFNIRTNKELYLYGTPYKFVAEKNKAELDKSLQIRLYFLKDWLKDLEDGKSN